ncbi:hypothetical protein AAHA92_25025 [Salvia divinorum]|uniref:Secreted protein n=1 Tax=Salvia divinorum TaxID=28513 RepID=A0ABD1GCF2_SALDI
MAKPLQIATQSLLSLTAAAQPGRHLHHCRRAARLSTAPLLATFSRRRSETRHEGSLFQSASSEQVVHLQLAI